MRIARSEIAIISPGTCRKMFANVASSSMITTAPIEEFKEITKCL
jgi:hypothetical protein